jgi:hypothetical protein
MPKGLRVITGDLLSILAQMFYSVKEDRTPDRMLSDDLTGSPARGIIYALE